MYKKNKELWIMVASILWFNSLSEHLKLYLEIIKNVSKFKLIIIKQCLIKQVYKEECTSVFQFLLNKDDV